MLKNVVWDFDGTLFDTYPVMTQALFEMLKEKGIEESLQALMLNMKISIGHTLKLYRAKYNLDDSFFENYSKRRRSAEIESAKPFEGMAEILETTINHGMQHFVYTHRDALTTALLEKYSLLPFFVDCFTSDLNFPGKPAPDALNALAAKHNLIKEECIMIGDRDIDVYAGHNAGMQACMVAFDLPIPHEFDGFCATTPEQLQTYLLNS